MSSSQPSLDFAAAQFVVDRTQLALPLLERSPLLSTLLLDPDHYRLAQLSSQTIAPIEWKIEPVAASTVVSIFTSHLTPPPSNSE
jgi:hypothetical protein